MSKWLGCVLVVAACGTLIRPADPDRRFLIKTDGAVFDADRGYRFIVLPERDAEVVRIDTRYPVGSIDDPPGKEGLSHLVEHLLSDVELKRDGASTSIDGELASVALSSNAHTTADETTYEATALPDALDALIRIEGERLAVGCTGISRELFEREREVVRNELRERGGGGGIELRRDLYAEIYPAGHPYRRVDSGETVAAITYEDVCGFLAGPYRRGTPIVAISGDVDVARVQKAVAAHFDRVPKRQPASTVTVQPAPVVTGVGKIHGAVDEPMLIATWPMPPKTSTEYRLLELAWPRIAGNLESYAFMFHWGHSASIDMIGGDKAPVVALTIELEHASDFDEAKKRVDSALRDTFYEIAQPGEEAKDRPWVRTWERRATRLISRWESLAGRNELATEFQTTTPNGSLVGWVKELETSTPAGVRGLAERWFTPERAHYVLVEPKDASFVGTASAFKGAIEQHGARVDRKLADQALPQPAVSPIHTERYTQSNGLSVVLAKGSDAPLVYSRLVVDAGDADVPFGKEGATYTVGASDVFADAMEFDGQSLSIRVDDLVLGASGPLRNPGYELDEEGQKYLVARLSQPRVVERAAFDTDLRLALYGEGHPYARSPMTAAGVKHLSHDFVQDWARREIAPKNSTLILVGSFDPALIKQHIAYNTDQVSDGARAKDVQTPPRTTPGFVVGTTAKQTPVVALSANFVGGHGVDDDYPKRMVLRAVLDAQLAQLREKRALTYGFYASYEARRAGGVWAIAGDVDAARAAEAGEELVHILDAMRSDPEVYRGAFVLGRQKVLEVLLTGSSTTAALADRIAFMTRFGLADDYFERVASAVAKLTLPELHRFLVRELAVDHQVIGAFGNAAPAKAAIDAARAAKPEHQGTIADPFQ